MKRLPIPEALWFLFRGLCLLTLLMSPSQLVLSSPLEDYFVFLENNKKGIRNADHEIVVPAMYDDLGWSTGEFQTLKDVVGYKENGLWGLMTLKNRKISSPEYISLYPLNRQFIAASRLVDQEEKYGLVDLNGNILMEFEYGRLSIFNNLIVASKKINSNWKFGMMNLSFLEVLPFNYTQIKAINNQYAVIMSGELCGLVNASGQVLIEPRYHDIELKGKELRGKFFDTHEIKNQQNQLIAKYQAKDIRKAAPGIVLISGRNQTHLLNISGSVVNTQDQTEVFDFVNDKAVVKQNGLFGVIDSHGKMVLTAAYKSIWMEGHYIGVEESSGEWKLLDSDLKKISSRNYQMILPATESLFPVKRLDSWGFMDEKGEEIIPPQYQEIGDFENGSAYAKYLGSWGVIDSNGNWKIKPRYEKLERLDQQTYLYQKQGLNGLVNTNQQEVYQTTNALEVTATGAIEMDSEHRYGLISTNGEKVLSLKYHRLHPFQEDPRYFLFQDDESLGIFNISQRIFFRDTAIQEIRTLEEGFIGVRINDQYGFIDLNGKLRIANRYQDVGVFNEGMLPIKIRGKWGYVDKLERLKVQPLYESTSSFINGVAIVSRDSKFGLIDNTGKIILKLEYDRIEHLPQGLFICYQGTKAGLVNAEGKVLTYPRYGTLEILENGNFIASQDGKLGLIDSKGKLLIPPQYDELTYDQFNDLYLLTKKYPWEIIKL